MKSKQKQTKLLEAVDLLEKAKDILDDLRGDEQSVYDERSDKWRESDKGLAAQDVIDTLESAVDTCAESLEYARQLEGL